MYHAILTTYKAKFARYQVIPTRYHAILTTYKAKLARYQVIPTRYQKLDIPNTDVDDHYHPPSPWL
uniref:Uncharacterized protein n=1 Tax=Oryza meridionalis TaxID=40149 RepID=A0A0E0F2Y8_9ORYZ